jgi:heme/copper-type cytochrome/quinol oxidase subunit 3
MKTAIVGLIAITWAIGLLFAAPQIHAWEKANGYPFGHMCNSVFTLYADTCVR